MSILVSDSINQAFEDLGVIRPGETITGALQASAFLVAQEIWDLMGLDKTFSNQWYHQAFALTAGLATYTVGTGGSLVSTADPVGIIAWQSASGNFKNGGSVVSFEQMENIAKDSAGVSSVLATAVAADGAYPSKNIRVYPTPASGPGTLTLDYWAKMPSFAAVSDALPTAPGYASFLRSDLARELYPRYARQGALSLQTLMENRQNALGNIRNLNASILGLQAAPAPQAA